MQSAAWGSVLLDLPVMHLCKHLSHHERLQHLLLCAERGISLNCQLLVFASGSPERTVGVRRHSLLTGC